MNKLFFPQGTLSIEDNKPVQEIAFSVCGGRKPAAAWLNMTAEKLPGTPEFFAADKGLDYYHAARLKNCRVHLSFLLRIKVWTITMPPGFIRIR